MSDNIPSAVRERWLAALKLHQPNLPPPVAAAMVERAAQGPLGQTLQQIEQALMALATTSSDDVTGSEARVLLAVLRQMRDELAQLEAHLAQLWP